MEVEELVYKAMKASGEESIRAFAKRLDVSHTAVGQWIKGDQVPTFEQAAELAKIANLPVVATAAGIRMKSKDGTKHKALLKQLAAGLGLLLVLILPTSITSKAQDYQQQIQTESADQARYYAK